MAVKDSLVIKTLCTAGKPYQSNEHQLQSTPQHNWKSAQLHCNPI